MAKRKEKHTKIPACAASMGCLCAGHAHGAPADGPCDTSERLNKRDLRQRKKKLETAFWIASARNVELAQEIENLRRQIDDED